MVERDGDAPGTGAHMLHPQGGTCATTGEEAKRQQHGHGGAEAAAEVGVAAQIVSTLRQGPLHQSVGYARRQVDPPRVATHVRLAVGKATAELLHQVP